MHIVEVQSHSFHLHTSSPPPSPFFSPSLFSIRVSRSPIRRHWKLRPLYGVKVPTSPQRLVHFYPFSSLPWDLPLGSILAQLSKCYSSQSSSANNVQARSCIRACGLRKPLGRRTCRKSLHHTLSNNPPTVLSKVLAHVPTSLAYMREMPRQAMLLLASLLDGFPPLRQDGLRRLGDPPSQLSIDALEKI